jgi:hypothetical protein
MNTIKNTWCGYEVQGMTLLHDLEGAMQLDHITDMSVHISTGTSYYINALMPFVWKVCVSVSSQK